MNNQELHAWSAGIIGAAGSLQVSQEDGPTGKKHMAMTLAVPVGDDVEFGRLAAVAGNGSHERGHFVLTGFQAVRGLYGRVWKYMTPSSRDQVNNAIRFYKAEKAKLK